MILLFATISVGTFGYVAIEGWSFLDAFYMTIITITTVGYSEINELSSTGRMFTLAIISAGVGLVFYLASSSLKFMLEGQIMQILGRRRLEKTIQKKKNHYILCGYGSVGSSICEALSGAKPVDLVLVERDPDRLRRLDEKKMHYVAGEATDEENLIKAGVERAKGLVSALRTDADNMFVALTARQLNPDLFIIARAASNKTESKLLAAGADKVVSPYRMGGHRIAQMISRPTVTDFLELTTMADQRNIQMEEVPVHPASKLVGVALLDSGIRKKFNLIIVAVRKPGGEMIFNPSSQTELHGGDTVVAIGDKESLEGLEQTLNPRGHIL
jgi:voltage-gated potassium channel